MVCALTCALSRERSRYRKGCFPSRHHTNKGKPKDTFPPLYPLGLDLRFDTTIRRITEGKIQMTAAFRDHVFYDCDFSSERTGAKKRHPSGVSVKYQCAL